jgi:hypothetical protein
MTSAVSKIINDLKDRGGLKGTDVANIASVSPATVSRWTAGKALPHPKTQLVISDLRYVVDRLSEFYTPDEIRLWLYSKHRLLNVERPIDLINQGDKILAAIESFDEGSLTDGVGWSRVIEFEYAKAKAIVRKQRQNGLRHWPCRVCENQRG